MSRPAPKRLSPLARSTGSFLLSPLQVPGEADNRRNNSDLKRAPVRGLRKRRNPSIRIVLKALPSLETKDRLQIGVSGKPSPAWRSTEIGVSLSAGRVPLVGFAKKRARLRMICRLDSPGTCSEFGGLNELKTRQNGADNTEIFLPPPPRTRKVSNTGRVPCPSQQ